MELCIYCDSQISVMILCVLSYSGSLCPRQKKKKKSFIPSFIYSTVTSGYGLGPMLNARQGPEPSIS